MFDKVLTVIVDTWEVRMATALCILCMAFSCARFDTTTLHLRTHGTPMEHV